MTSERRDTAASVVIVGAMEPPAERMRQRPHVLAYALATAAVITLAIFGVASVEASDDTFELAVPAREDSFETSTDDSADSADSDDSPGAAMPIASPSTPNMQRVDQEPIVQMPKRPTLKPKALPVPSPRAQPRPPAPAVHNAPTPQQLAELYTQVGRELATATKVDPNTTIDLWPRFRWVNFMDAITTPAKRAAAAAVLEKLLVEAQKLHP